MVIAGVLLATACGGSSGKHGVACDEPGVSERCVCPGQPEDGTRTCGEDGYWGECDCETPFVDATDGSGGATVGVGGSTSSSSGGVDAVGGASERGGSAPQAGAAGAHDASGGASDGGSAGGAAVGGSVGSAGAAGRQGSGAEGGVAGGGGVGGAAAAAAGGSPGAGGDIGGAGLGGDVGTGGTGTGGSGTGGEQGVGGDQGVGGNAGAGGVPQAGGAASGGASGATAGQAGAAAGGSEAGAPGAGGAPQGFGGTGVNLAGAAGGGNVPPTPACIVHVKPLGNDSNDGTSWDSAKATVQAGINTAWQGGCVVWVAAGTYFPTTTSMRIVSFQLQENTAVYGGFSGSETAFGQRDPEAHETILSGDIGLPGDASDNAYHVVVAANGATLDGFTITGGNADGDDNDRYGGGIYSESSELTIDRCVFQGNSARNGGGIYSVGSELTVDRCVFQGNSAIRGGGGIDNTGEGLHVVNSTFRQNTVTYSVTTIGTSAYGGAGLRHRDGSATVTACRFEQNSTDAHGGGLLSQTCALVVSDCLFSENHASNGGGLILYGGSAGPVIRQCTFFANTAETDGGGLYVRDNNAVVENSEFLDNTADGSGGGVMVSGNGVRVTRCYLSGNAALLQGGGLMRITDRTMTVEHSWIIDNVAGTGGGGLCNQGAASLTNTVFVGNTSDSEGGGAIYNDDGGSLSLLHGTLANNDAPVGSAIFNYPSTTDLTITSSIIWAWEDGGIPVFGSNVTAAYTLNDGGYLAGDGNSASNPQFFNLPAGDVRLSAGSPALDAAYPPAAPPVDINGFPRDATPDIGAYEGAVTDS